MKFYDLVEESKYIAKINGMKNEYEIIADIEYKYSRFNEIREKLDALTVNEITVSDFNQNSIETDILAKLITISENL